MLHFRRLVAQDKDPRAVFHIGPVALVAGARLCHVVSTVVSANGFEKRLGTSHAKILVAASLLVHRSQMLDIAVDLHRLIPLVVDRNNLETSQKSLRAAPMVTIPCAMNKVFVKACHFFKARLVAMDLFFPSMTVNRVTFQIDIRKTVVGVVGGIAGYHLWRNKMIAWHGHAAVVPHPYLFAFAVAVMLNTKIISNGRR